MRSKQILRLQEAGWDLDLAAKTQPQGNLRESAQHLQVGDGYVTCIRLYKYPSHGLGPFWGIPLTNNDGTMAVMDFGTEDKNEILQALSRSAVEKKTQISGKAKEADNVEAADAYRDQMRLMQELQSGREVMKRFYLRIFVYDKTLEGLEKKVNEITRDNGQFGMVRYANEQLNELKSIWVPTMKEQDMLNHPVGTPINSYALGASYPFNHVKLDDPNGTYYGYTKTNGAVEFDPFHRDNRRTRSFFFVTGNAGMGKSTLLKKMNDDVYARGAYIRNFDVSSEYSDQTRDQGGVVIRLDRPEYLINPFEVFATAVNDDGSVDEINSMAQNINKLKNMFRFLNEDVTSDDVNTFGDWVEEFYRTNDLWVKNPQKQKQDVKVTGLPHDMYPTLQDFVIFANEKQRSVERDPQIHKTSLITTSMNRITQTFQSLENANGDMFDGITRFPDLSKEQVVTFNIQGLQAKGDAIFNAQIYSVLSLLSADIIRNGMQQRALLKQGKLDTNFARYYYLNIDEVENIISPKFQFGVEFLASMMEQMRKNMCAITMAAPTIKDLIMNGNSSDPYILAVQKIFSLFQIRFFFQISDDDLPRLATALGGSTTEDELQNLTRLERTEVLMNINGDRNVQFKVQITKQEERRYGGGI